MRKLMIAILSAVTLAVFTGSTAFAAAGVKPPKQDWTFSGMFGTFDRAALQRGYQVYAEVCAGCHSARLLSYRNLRAIGFTEDQVKKIAAEFEVNDGPNDEGEMFDRPARPGDRFVMPFPNEQAARAGNNGAMPPDLSLIVKARKGGADYLHALLTGYKDAPAGTKVPEGMAYNIYFPGNQIAMPAPISEDAVEYADKTKATVDQMSRDVTAFLAWASEPELEERKRMGIKVMLFLIVLTGMLYAVKRKIWANIGH